MEAGCQTGAGWPGGIGEAVDCSESAREGGVGTRTTGMSARHVDSNA